MKNIKYLFYSLLSTAIVFTSCDSEDDLIEERLNETAETPVDYIPGTADFTNYISIGNSLTAGYMDGALYTEGQDSSFPNIIGQQMVAAGLTENFNQPDINAVNGYNPTFSNPGAGVIAGKTILDISIPGPVPTFPGDLITAYSGDKSALNNFGVPGAKVADLLNPLYGTTTINPVTEAPYGNPYFIRFGTAPGTKSIMDDALATNPTFYTLWIGSNDVLGYALSGGTTKDPTDGSVIDANAPLETYTAAQFQTDYGTIIGQLAAKGAKGVVINMPVMLTIPYLRAISYDAIELRQGQADTLNVGLKGVNDALDALVAFVGHDAADAARRKISYSEGPNPILVIDEELEDLGPKFNLLGLPAGDRAKLVPYEQSRPLVEGELVTLAAGAVLGTEADGDDSENSGPTPIGVAVPLGFNVFTGALSGDQYYLTMVEQTAVVTARATYSAIIEGIAAAYPGVEMYDIQPLFADIAGLTSTQAAQLALSTSAQAAADGVQGIVYEGVKIAPDFSPSGLFSTDGVHPNPRGHAILANNLIDFINSKFGANIPKVNSTVYRTVLFQ